MSRFGSSISWILILCFFILSLTFVDFLALADIHKDYVSDSVLESLGIAISDKLPDWSSAKLEWTWIRTSLFLKAVFIVAIIVILLRIAKKLNN